MKKQPLQGPLLKELGAIAGLRLKESEALAPYTSIKVGGPADYFIDVQTEEALAGALAALKRHGVTCHLLGRGSNVLVSDRGVRGAVLRLGAGFHGVQWRQAGDKAEVVIGAAYPIARLVRLAATKGYGGLEFAEGIPGSVGGALVMNAGAFGSEMEKIVERVEGVAPTGDPVVFQRRDLAFTYRSARLPAGTVVTRVAMRLEKAEPEAVVHRVRDLTRLRKTSQPSGLPSAGSMFRNPTGDYAGRLIEEAGLKGAQIGKAKISEHHANFIVNLGGASAGDVRRLMELAGTTVRERCGVELEPEVQFLGEWTEWSLEGRIESRIG
ncbi:MAG TPA: UDP-N-acetylmuramate dehydrogenase [Candidatus Binatia bacterium]